MKALLVLFFISLNSYAFECSNDKTEVRLEKRGGEEVIIVTEKMNSEEYLLIEREPFYVIAAKDFPLIEDENGISKALLIVFKPLDNKIVLTRNNKVSSLDCF